jgi:hypothetical protein
MDRSSATQFMREEMNRHGLQDWSARLNQDSNSRFLGLCSHRDRAIIISAHHIDIHPVEDVHNTVRHEIAHALTPGHAHDEVWIQKAKELGCTHTAPCSNLSLDPRVIDAIRSGADVEITFDEKVIQVPIAFEEQIVRTPKYNITRLQEKCPTCGKVAVKISEETIRTLGDTEPDLHIAMLECGHKIVTNVPKGTPFHTFHVGGSDSCKHKWNKNKCVLCSRYRPYDFQIEGMKFLEAGLAVNKGAACFDEMGLGKTIQAAGVVYFTPSLWPILWIDKSGLKYQKSSVILNWMNPDPKNAQHIPQIVNTSKDYLWPGLKHYIIGYDMLVQKSRTLKSGKVVSSGFDISQFDRVGIKCVVLDECQQIKNVDSSRTQMVRRIVKGRKVIALSGTPWNNRGSELFPVFNMMDPMKFPSEEKFKRDWVEYFYQGQFLKEGGIKRHKINAFKEYTKDICVRRERREVLAELPTVNRTKLNIMMTPQEEQDYDAAVDEFVKWYESQAQALSGMAIIAAMQKMRHLVALAKVPATLEYVDEFVEETDRKLVIFAHHRDVQAILFEELKQKYGNDMPVLQYTADMNSFARNETCDKFNQSPRALLVGSQLALGEGMNLQTCCDCLMHERQWNPGKEEQCEGRFIRIGAVSVSVNAIYAHLEGLTTTDPKLDAIIEGKRSRFHSLMNKGEAEVWNEDAIMKELAASIVNAHNAKKGKK